MYKIYTKYQWIKGKDETFAGKHETDLEKH